MILSVIFRKINKILTISGNNIQEQRKRQLTNDAISNKLREVPVVDSVT